MEDNKYLLNLAQIQDKNMRQLILTTDQLELNCQLIVDEAYFSQQIHNIGKQKASYKDYEGLTFFEFTENNYPNLEIGLEIIDQNILNIDQLQEIIQNYDDNGYNLQFLYHQIIIQPDNFEDFFDLETKENQEHIFNSEKLLQIKNNILKKWEVYGRLAEISQQELKNIIFDIQFEKPSKECKITSIKNIHRFFEQIFTDFIFVLQNSKEEIEWDRIQISSNIGDIFLMLEKKGNQGHEACFKSLRTLARSIPPAIKNIYFTTNFQFSQLHDLDSRYLMFLRHLNQMEVMKSWSTNIIIGEGYIKKLEEVWNSQDIGFMSAQIVFFKMLRRLIFALNNQRDPDEQQQQNLSYTLGTI